jgi:hypothetical protein
MRSTLAGLLPSSMAGDRPVSPRRRPRTAPDGEPEVQKEAAQAFRSSAVMGGGGGGPPSGRHSTGGDLADHPAFVHPDAAAEIDLGRARGGLQRGWHGQVAQLGEQLREHLPVEGPGAVAVGQQDDRDAGVGGDAEERRLADGVAVVADDPAPAPVAPGVAANRPGPSGSGNRHEGDAAAGLAADAVGVAATQRPWEVT